MPVNPEKKYEIKQAMPIKIALSIPNNSIPSKVQAIGVLLAPANTAAKPIPASKATGKGTNHTNAFPSVAPIKKSGVTSPPLKPAPMVNVVNRILSRKS